MNEVSQPTPAAPAGLGGWLLVLILLLLLWQPLSLGLVASGALRSLTLRGLPLALILALRLIAVAFGIAAGLALLGRRAAAVTMARVSLLASAATDVVVYATPYFPNTRPPGDATIVLAVSMVYYCTWLLYLARSKRVRNTFG
jgi:hypothetical protein